MDEQTPQDETPVSQETPDQASELQTPQADQPVPTEPNRDGESQVTQTESAPDAAQAAEPVQNQSAPDQPSPSEYTPSRPPLQNAGLDQQAAEDQRQAELKAQRDEHNARVGGGAPAQSDAVDGSQDADQA